MLCIRFAFKHAVTLQSSFAHSVIRADCAYMYMCVRYCNHLCFEQANVSTDALGNTTGATEYIKSSANSTAAAGKIANDRLEHRSRIDVFENAFRKIKEATGVSDVNEVSTTDCQFAQ
jgi:hypothetical protein